MGLDPYRDLYPIRCGGCTLADALYMLGCEPSDYDKESMAWFHKESSIGLSVWELMNLVREGKNELIGDPCEAVANSDLIIIALGINDLIYYPNVKSFGGGVDAQTTLGKALYFTKYMQIGFNDILENYPKLLDKLRELNPDAEIVLVNVINGASDLSVFDEVEFNAGELFGPFVDAVNNYLMLLADRYDAEYVDVRAVEHMGFGGGHPSVEGYNYIANRIINTLNYRDKKICLPRCGEVRLEFSGVNAGYLSLEKQCLGWAISDPENGMISARNGEIVYGNDCGAWWYDGGFYTLGKVKISTDFGCTYFKFSRNYLTLDSNGGFGLSSNRVKAEMFVKA